jgi:hypothetical protein
MRTVAEVTDGQPPSQKGVISRCGVDKRDPLRGKVRRGHRPPP